MRPVMAIVILSVVTLLAACSKDKFETTPKIEIDSVEPDVISQGGVIRIRLKFFDKEGDLSDGTLTYIRVKTNTILHQPQFDQPDTIHAKLPKFPEKSQGDIMLDIDYNYMNENDDPLSLGKNDSMYFRLVVMDTEDHVSDTVNTKIVVAVQ
jgi:hypothetical protein